jgi:hypothetical protein
MIATAFEIIFDIPNVRDKAGFLSDKIDETIARTGFIQATRQYGKSNEKSKTILYSSLTGLVLLPLFYQESKVALHRWEMPEQESSSVIRNEVLSHLGDKKITLAVTPDQYFTFRKQKEVVNITYVCEHLEDYDYVYLSRLISSELNYIPKIDDFCPGKGNHFNMDKDLRVNRQLSLFGHPLSHVARGNGGILFRKKPFISSQL